MNFSIIQMSMKAGDKDANVSKAEKMIDEAVEKYSANIVGLPELFTAEYFAQWIDRKYFSYAEPIPGPTTNRIAKKAKQHGIYIIAPIFEEARKGEYYNSAAMIAPDGRILGVYRKMHIPMGKIPELGSWGYEKFYFRSGSDFPVFETKLGTIGIYICWDRHFPEGWRILTLKGADVIFVPVASMGKFLGETFSMEIKIMAYQNQCYVAAANRVGVEGELNFYGGSHIVDPIGNFIAGPASDKEEETLCATLDLDIVRQVRSIATFQLDRKPEVYGKLIEHQPLRELRIQEKSEYGRVIL